MSGMYYVNEKTVNTRLAEMTWCTRGDFHPTNEPSLTKVRAWSYNDMSHQTITADCDVVNYDPSNPTYVLQTSSEFFLIILNYFNFSLIFVIRFIGISDVL